jgi:hypothetical protein
MFYSQIQRNKLSGKRRMYEADSLISLSLFFSFVRYFNFGRERRLLCALMRTPELWWKWVASSPKCYEITNPKKCCCCCSDSFTSQPNQRIKTLMFPTTRNMNPACSRKSHVSGWHGNAKEWDSLSVTHLEASTAATRTPPPQNKYTNR